MTFYAGARAEKVLVKTEQTPLWWGQATIAGLMSIRLSQTHVGRDGQSLRYVGPSPRKALMTKLF